MKRKLSKKQEQQLVCQKLKSDISNMRLFGKPTARVAVQKKAELSMQDVLRMERNGGKQFKSAPLTPPTSEQKLPIRYEDEELAERERLAQIEIQRKKKRVAIATNKGAYQYITEETDLTTIGKKI